MTTATEAQPYKGAYSYQVEDEHLFFGRERETGHLVAKVLGSRFTLLHARSGAGKSSLLNARLVPRLQARGWTVVRAEPGDNPTKSLREAVLRTLLPPPYAEAAAIQACLDCFPGSRTISDLLEAFDGLNIRDERRLRIIMPTVITSSSELFTSGDRVRTAFSKLLLSHNTVDDYCAHLSTILSSRTGASVLTRIDPKFFSLDALQNLLSSDEFISAYNTLIHDLIRPDDDLSGFLANVIESYGTAKNGFSIVVILDQFEELFTRFVDPGILKRAVAVQPLDWRLRREFFEEFGRLYHYRKTTELESAGDLLPIRFVISIRDDYLALLEDIHPIVGPLEDNMFHLNLFAPAEASMAIRGPAKEFGYDYSEPCINRIVADLTREERFVEPAHLSIVCARLWKEYGREISAGPGFAGDNDQEALIDEHEFEKLGGAAGIISSFFEGFLTGLAIDERLETVEILSRLITKSGTRNIVEQSALIHAPFRDMRRRERLLGKLIDYHGVVRAEYRYGGRFISITHEFLIEPILKAVLELRSSNAAYSQLEWALEMLYTATGMGLEGAVATLLPEEAFNILNKRYEEVVWDELGIVAMLRYSVARQNDKSVVRKWIDRYQSGPVEELRQQGLYAA